MSFLQQSLDLFGFKSIDDLNIDSLKIAFKLAVLETHPDRGGTNDDIEKIIHSNIFLIETLNRINGGRSLLQNITSPDEIKNLRINEYINQTLNEFELKQFNTLFEKTHIPENQKGYESWLKSDAIIDDNNSTNENTTLNESDKEITIPKPTFSENDFHKVFLETYTHKEINNSMILHPDEMARYSGNQLGTSLIPSENDTFTSEYNSNPLYTDLYSAYTNDNIISDKVPKFIEKNREEMLNELQKEIEPTEDDLIRISNWEKKKLETDTKHRNNLSNYFTGEYNGNYYSSHSITNSNPENDKQSTDVKRNLDNFIIQF